ncbi:Tubulin polyglutamylase TTLL7 [Varanus komodoensis]|nr:Tubulin polyglutamylase TTLL7 [Varanus komodoensis]
MSTLRAASLLPPPPPVRNGSRHLPRFAETFPFAVLPAHGRLQSRCCCRCRCRCRRETSWNTSHRGGGGGGGGGEEEEERGSGSLRLAVDIIQPGRPGGIYPLMKGQLRLPRDLQMGEEEELLLSTAGHWSISTAFVNDDQGQRGAVLSARSLHGSIPTPSLLNVLNRFKTSSFHVRVVIEEMGYVKTRDDDETANLIWSDSAVQQEKIAELRNYQRINHFPGMGEICRKDFLARNMTKMIKSQPQEYSFIPRTWVFPAEYTQFQNYVKELKRKRRQKTFIVKPANGAMGHGISLTRNAEKLHSQEHLIVQEYLDKPFLMEGYKFDLRVYILVTSCDPLKIFLYHDGLVRMGTEKYHPPSESNLSQLYMHLTNYSVNKHNERFERDETEDKGSKRSIKWFTEFLQTNHLDVSKFWNDISELVVKTLIVAEPHVLHAYRMCRPGQSPGSDSVCFEVLGFDILLDRKLKPWLLEINRAPSFGTDQKIDYDVKKGVLLNALKLLNIRPSDKRKNLAKQKAEAQKRLYGQGSMKRLSPVSSDWEKQRRSLERRREELKERLAQVRRQISKEEHENRHMGNYRRIYPPDDKLLLEKYEGLLAAAFQTFLAGRAASLQRELNNPLKKMKEEDILDLLEQCELDDEKLMGKTVRPRGPKPLYSMPESAQFMKKSKNYSSSSSSCESSSDISEWEEEAEKEDENVKKEKNVSFDLEDRKLIERSSRMHWKRPLKKVPSFASATPLAGPIRRSVSCPRSISGLNIQAAENRPFSAKPVVQLSRPSSVSRSHSLNRGSSTVKMSHTANLGTVHSSVVS